MDAAEPLWTEKYRPTTFHDIKGHDEITQQIEALVKKHNIPHVLLAGPPGSGKTTVALIIAKTLHGEHWRNNFLELNSSDDRGIDVVRTTIKDFARTKAIGTNTPKIILLDECDALTREAQQALRRTMETHAQTTRFILSANYSSKIIEPIQSRCAVFRFKPLSDQHIEETIITIAKHENITIDDHAVKALTTAAEGDIRKAINTLQACASYDKKITEKTVYGVITAARPQDVKDILHLATTKNFAKAREKLLDVMLNHGLSGIDIIKQIQKEIWNLNLSDEKKIRLVEKCGEAEFCMVEGSDEYVQLESLLASLTLAEP